MSFQRPLNALKTFRKLVKRDGLKDTLKKVWVTGHFYPDDALIGTDNQGNKYYERKSELNTRQRYVIFSKTNNIEGDVDASRVPSEYHGWLHYTEKEYPKDIKRKAPIFKLPHQNATLSNQGAFPKYVPPGHIVNKHKDEDFKDYAKPVYTKWNNKSE